jgi:hypothetical protein
MRKKIDHLILVFLVTLVGGAASFSAAQQLRRTLHDRAIKAGGKLVWRYRANRSLIYPNVEELAKRSDVIVVGRSLGHRPSLSPDGTFITNDFLVRVQDVIKGDVPSGKSIVVSLPGGAYRFSDGTFAALMPANYKQAEDGGTYVFFLKKKKIGSVFKGHMLASETQGLFALKEGKVEPADSVRSDPVVVKYRGMGAANFLAQIHMAVPRKKK